MGSGQNEIIGKGLSLLVYVAYLIAGYISLGGAAMVKIGVLFLLPLICIWFPEPLGKFTGVMGLQAITAQTPAFLVSVAGWFLLVVVPLVVYFVIGA